MTRCKPVFIQTPLGLADEVARLSHEKRMLTEALIGILACCEADSALPPNETYSLRGPVRQAIQRAEAALFAVKKGAKP